MEREPDPYCISDRFAAKNGMKVIELGDGFARCQMTMDESTLNGLGIPMGGAYFTLADFCFGAANDYISNSIVTLNSNIEYIASAKVGDVVTATCTTIAKARKIVRNEIEVRNQDDKLLCLVRCVGYRKETWK